MNERIRFLKRPTQGGTKRGRDTAQEELASLAWGLAHPARVAILRLLLEKGECGCGAPGSTCCTSELEYSAAEKGAVPEGANLGLGCGAPVALAGPKPGETVLDLGSGAGVVVFLAAREVGPEGRVIGVDMTPAM